MLDTLEECNLWVRIMDWETVESIHDIRADVLHNMKNLSYMSTELS